MGDSVIKKLFVARVIKMGITFGLHGIFEGVIGILIVRIDQNGALYG